MDYPNISRKKPDAILFDLDNTLYDFYNAKMKACCSVIDIFGKGEPDTLFSYFLFGSHGFENHKNIHDYMKDLNINDEGLLKSACECYESVKLENIKTYPGVKKTLAFLVKEGIKMAIVTDADIKQASLRLDKAGITRFFQFIITPEISGKRKPNPESFNLALKRLSVKPFGTWMVGDSLHRDIEPGNRLGLTTFHAKYGEMKGIRSSNVKPDFTLQKFGELSEILRLSTQVPI